MLISISLKTCLAIAVNMLGILNLFKSCNDLMCLIGEPFVG